jgi:methylmalonyl-CoA/ethylmalonyl-CoA epimerase
MAEQRSTAPLQNATLCQIGFVARDGARLAGKFARLTGLPVPEPVLTDGFEKAHTLHRGTPTPATAKLFFLNFGQVAIEIIEPVGAPSTWREFLDKHGDGVHHIAFTVGNADQSAATLAAEGVPVVQSGVFEGGKYIYLEGEKELSVLLELLEFTSP